MSDIVSATDEVLLARNGGALFVTLNRPQAKNALTAAMTAALGALARDLEGRRDIRAVVLRGAGGAFCAGGDVKDFARHLMAEAPKAGEIDPVIVANRSFGDLLLQLDALEQALIVAVEGPAFGGANGFMAVADVVIAEKGARFALSEATLGLIPAQIAPFLTRRIGAFATRRLALTGAAFDAEEALRIGLVDRIADGAAALEAGVFEILNAIGRCEPNAMAATKSIIARAGEQVDRAALDDAAAAFACSLRGAGRAGATAFASKAAPPWVEAYKGALTP
jgi:isohexenylglutaconyl-CoA hydratase